MRNFPKLIFVLIIAANLFFSNNSFAYSLTETQQQPELLKSIDLNLGVKGANDLTQSINESIQKALKGFSFPKSEKSAAPSKLPSPGGLGLDFGRFFDLSGISSDDPAGAAQAVIKLVFQVLIVVIQVITQMLELAFTSAGVPKNL